MAVGKTLTWILLIVLVLFVVGALGTFGPIWATRVGPLPGGPPSR